ncbi:unnamed protein product, partial [marine sediment metagenome]
LLFDLNVTEWQIKDKKYFEVKAIPKEPFKKTYIRSHFDEKELFGPIGVDNRSHALTLAYHRDLVKAILMERLDFYKTAKEVKDGAFLREDIYYELNLRQCAFDWLKDKLNITTKDQLKILATIVYDINPYHLRLNKLKNDPSIQRLLNFKKALIDYMKKKGLSRDYNKEELLAPTQVDPRSHTIILAFHKNFIGSILLQKLKHNHSTKGKKVKTKPKTKTKKLIPSLKDHLSQINAKLSQNKVKYAGIFLSILGTFLLALLSFTSSSTIFFPQDIKFLFFLIQVGLSFFFLYSLMDGGYRATP